jgi:hypothetical protein
MRHIDCFNFHFPLRCFICREFLFEEREELEVRPITQREQKRSHNSHHRGTDPRQRMELLLALDRMLVEVSMRLYNLPRHEQLAMRKQNRHLHRAVREQLPHPPKSLAAGPSRTLDPARIGSRSSMIPLRVR